MNLFFSILLITIFSTALYARDNDKDPKASFNQAYSQYEQAIQQNDVNATVSYAKKSYQLGLQVFGKHSISSANLAVNYASALIQVKRREKATELLNVAIPIIKNKMGEHHLELVPVYQKLAESLRFSNTKKSNSYLTLALGILDKQEQEDPVFIADLKTEVGTQLLKNGSRKSAVIVDANKTLAEHLKPNDRRLVLSNFYAGKFYMTSRNSSKAVDYLSRNIPVFESLDGATHPLELSTRAFLIQALEKKGKSDEATKHCIAIGEMTPWNGEQEQIPLYRQEPRYPTEAIRNGTEGWVQLSFNISPYGFVENVETIKASGHKGFIREAKKAIKNWRYAPKFVNGEAVTANSKVQLDFKLGSS